VKFFADGFEHGALPFFEPYCWERESDESERVVARGEQALDEEVFVLQGFRRRRDHVHVVGSSSARSSAFVERRVEVALPRWPVAAVDQFHEPAERLFDLFGV
jgi:hypothetical protein